MNDIWYLLLEKVYVILVFDDDKLRTLMKFLDFNKISVTYSENKISFVETRK